MRKRIGLQQRAIRVREYQIQIRPVVSTVLLAELLLPPAVCIEGMTGRRRKTDHANAVLGLRIFELQDLSGLCERSRDHYAAILDVGPAKRHDLATAHSRRGDTWRNAGRHHGPEALA